MLNVSEETLRWLDQQTEELVGSSRKPGLEGLASALKAWAMELQKSSQTLSVIEPSGEPIMKRLILHIGMAKTGTSSIQEALGDNADLLAGQEVYYPGWKPFNHSFIFTVLFLEKPKKSFYYQQLAPIDDQDWEDELRRLGEQWRTFFTVAEKGSWVVSAENLGRLSHKEIAALRAFVEPFFDQVQVIAYVRDPLRALKSQWEQDVKELREPLSGQQVLDLTKRRLNYRFFQRWIDAFGRDHFVLRRFQPDNFTGGSLLNDFLHAAQIEVEAALELQQSEANQSLGSEGVALLLAMNSRYPLYRDGQYNAERGLARRLHLFYRAMRESGANALSLDVKFNAEEAAGFNRKIGFLNSLLPEGQQFPEVSASESETVLPDATQVPAEYAVEFVNHLSLLVDQMADKVDHLQDRIKTLEEEAGKGQ